MDRKDFIKKVGLAGIGLPLLSYSEIVNYRPQVVLCIGTRVPGSIGQTVIQQGCLAYQIIDRPTYSEHYFGVPKILLKNEYINYASDFGWFTVEEEKLILGAYRAMQNAMPGIQKLIPPNANVLIVSGLGCASTIGIVRALLDLCLTMNSVRAVVTLPFGYESSRVAGLQTFEYIRTKCSSVTYFDPKSFAPDTLIAGAHKKEQHELAKMVNKVLFEDFKPSNL